MIIAILTVAHAASLDNLEVAGQWGSPTATNPSAAWWNPAGLAGAPGHQILVEGAPTFAEVSYQRTEPHAGEDSVTQTGVVPFFGVSSDFGIEGLGVGASLSVPMVRGGRSEFDEGAARYHLQEGDITGIATSLAAAYRWREIASVGLAAHRVQSSWGATLASETMPDLYDELIRQDQQPDPDYYNDDNLENPDYAATLELGPLVDTAWTWSAGVMLTPTERLTIGLSYTAGYELNHKGEAEIQMGCPPQDDVVGRFGSESLGLCDATLAADASIAYTIPYRMHAGVAFEPIEPLRLEVFGGLVGWSSFDDFAVVVSGVADKNPQLEEDAAALVEQSRLWARDNQDSFFAGFDAKGDLSERWMLGGRLLFDNAAVPDVAVGPNNYDSDALITSGLLAFRPIEAVAVGLSYSHHFFAERTITDSGFAMTLDPDSRAEDRWFYPHSNGTYNVTIDRVALSVSAAF